MRGRGAKAVALSKAVRFREVHRGLHTWIKWLLAPLLLFFAVLLAMAARETALHGWSAWFSIPVALVIIALFLAPFLVPYAEIRVDEDRLAYRQLLTSRSASLASIRSVGEHRPVGPSALLWARALEARAIGLGPEPFVEVEFKDGSRIMLAPLQRKRFVDAIRARSTVMGGIP